MRIAFLNQYYPPFSASTSHLLFDVASSLAARGHTITVVTGRAPYMPEEAGVEAASREVKHGVTIVRVGRTYADRARPLRRVTGYAAYLLGALAILLRLPRQDLIVSMTTPPYLVTVGAVAARLKRTPLALWLMDMYPEALASNRMLEEKSLSFRMLRRIARAAYRACRRVIVLDRYMEERLIALGVTRDRIRVCQNWEGAASVDSEPVRDGARRFRETNGLQSSDFVVLYFGSLGLAHDVDTILGAMKRLRDERSIKFVFVGGGTRLGTLRAAVEEAGLQNVRFAAAVSKDDISIPLAAADAGLVTMLDEWNGVLSPSKLYSLLAAGLPVLYIGPERSEVADTINTGAAGSAHRIGDVDGVVAAILRWRNDPDSRRAAGRRAHQVFLDRFTREKGVARVENALVSAVGDPS